MDTLMRKLVLVLFLSLSALPAFGAHSGTFSGSPTFATAKFATGTSSTNDSNYITLPSGTFNITSGNSWTVEAWLKHSGTGTYIAVAVGTGTNNGWFGSDAGKFTVSVTGSGAFSGGAKLSSGITINDSVFHHCVMVMTGGTTISTYVDGVAGATFSGVITAPSSDGMIGRFGTVGYSWPGAIDEVAIWSTNEYTGSFTPPSATYAGSESNLRALYPLDGNATDLAGTVVVIPTAANWLVSPYNWYSDGGGAMQSNNVHAGSTYIQAVNPGAYFKCVFSGTSAVATVIETQITNGNWPVVKWSVDSGAWQSHTANGSETSITLATGLASASHTLLLYFEAADGTADRWTTPIQSIKIANLILDTGAALQTLSADVTQLSKSALFFGDSITEGLYVNGYNGNSTLVSDSQLSWTYGVAQALGAEYGNVAFGCQGWSVGGCSGSNVPAMPTSWDHYFSNVSRLSTGKLSPIPDYVIVNLGTNDGATNIQSTVVTWLASIRAAVNTNTPIVLIVPFGQNQAANIIAAAATAADSRVFVVNLGTTVSAGMNGTGISRWVADSGGLHPIAAADGWLGAMVAQKIQALTYSVTRSFATAN